MRRPNMPFRILLIRTIALFSKLTAVSLLWSACAGQSFGNGTNQQQAQWCDGKSGMCMAINIPSASAPDYYLAITAPQAIGYLAVM
jgi:hypothetical protein